MCRHLAYLGAPIPVAQVVLDAPRSLREQARVPHHQRSGDSNPDGWGVGWHVERTAAPLRHRTTTPVWQDHDAATVLAGVIAPSFVAAARLASPGSPVEVASNAPFASGRWLFSLNGYVADFHGSSGEALRAGLSPARAAEIRGSSDTEVLFAMVLDRLDAGAPPGVALHAVVADVRARTAGRLNLLLHDGQRLAATACGNSLFVDRRPGAVIVASEPIDDEPGWEPVADDTLVEATLTVDGETPRLRIGSLR